MLAISLVAGSFSWSAAQQGYRCPDPRTMKQLTTKYSDHAPDIPGDETLMEYYSAPNGIMVTIYSHKGKNIAFSSYSQSDVQNTYRLFIDYTGNGVFQEVDRSIKWTIPPWAR